MKHRTVILELTVSKNVTPLLFTSHETASAPTVSRDSFTRKMHFVDKNSIVLGEETAVKREILSSSHRIFRILIKQI